MISFPNDPEEAADALIAAFARRSSRNKLILPTRLPAELSDAALEEQPCVVLQAKAKTFAGLQLTAAPEVLVKEFAASDFVGAIANVEEFDVTGLRSTELSWLGGHLAVLPHREGKIEVPFFVRGRTITLADRTNEWIYAAMDERPPPQLNEGLLGFVRFFYTAVKGQIGSFQLADQVEDALWLPNAAEDVRREFTEKLDPFHIVGVAEDGRMELRGTVVFKNALFVTSNMIALNWQMELTDETLLMEDLPIEYGLRADLLVRR
jgi:hypothetical protein